jgi:hypothetical protein
VKLRRRKEEVRGWRSQISAGDGELHLKSNGRAFNGIRGCGARSIARVKSKPKLGAGICSTPAVEIGIAHLPFSLRAVAQVFSFRRFRVEERSGLFAAQEVATHALAADIVAG